MLENTLKEAPLACPAQVTGQLVFTRGSFSGKQKNYSPFTPNNAWTGYLQHKLPDKMKFAQNALTNLRQRIFGYKRDISQTGDVFIEWRKPLFIRVLSASNVPQNASAKKTLKKLKKGVDI
ncbi:MAG: hypothetical protein E7201_03355 [Selenomonas ruminantium]|uniref:Uncharacterized protein n=1 Tax=Selenomonas ruminantium TaxID=971 RepID=A0A927WHX9_SELRU|nr:hypothetical protein [Selenomonas ruminantium]